MHLFPFLHIPLYWTMNTIHYTRNEHNAYWQMFYNLNHRWPGRLHWEDESLYILYIHNPIHPIHPYTQPYTPYTPLYTTLYTLYTPIHNPIHPYTTLIYELVSIVKYYTLRVRPGDIQYTVFTIQWPVRSVYKGRPHDQCMTDWLNFSTYFSSL